MVGGPAPKGLDDFDPSDRAALVAAVQAVREIITAEVVHCSPVSGRGTSC